MVGLFLEYIGVLDMWVYIEVFFWCNGLNLYYGAKNIPYVFPGVMGSPAGKPTQ